ncbi:bifunctional protein-disulfide isomerase/oxidoreductase DsbC [Shewanella phaeophyticola]|uniref:Thiol:disulfide interchange protein n=1 Tax=Shewanella phaeophyticola TaxID=2978345 RepID=A0ABT2NYJ7_9GAMM|nr:bifunctional protein-disulfide isomerase/oxidoreductase DsbC [Shewanella sp. KJ10-1]MCT8985482.1 bifunctional protein-disulfide isomerase/oxidoreductase DsbC [Shewanella sp. KJ10-1]MCU7376302.1 bifunctional protein-disulfide isomerase/oxidoreductase DsbC [Paucibacter sp. O1-1]MDA3831314.1 bifunctional protein-disulfide isomerase/oxidoreductase DsbC [Paucibacter sp. O1-1]
MKLTKAIALVASLVIAPIVFAATATDVSNESALKQKLTETLGVNVAQIQPSPVDGLYQVFTDRGVLYVTQDGSKLFHGNLYDLDQGMKNLTELALAAPRLEMLKPFEQDMLVYKAKDEKHVVTIFTDVDCGFCRKLHNQMQGYNDLGITIRYLAYPRAGIPSANADEMQAVWCAKDPLKAMTEAKTGGNVTSASCDIDIAKQFQLGQAFGVNGTPAIVLENGVMVPGYQPPADLLRTIESNL